MCGYVHVGGVCIHVWVCTCRGCVYTCVCMYMWGMCVYMCGYVHVGYVCIHVGNVGYVFIQVLVCMCTCGYVWICVWVCTCEVTYLGMC